MASTDPQTGSELKRCQFRWLWAPSVLDDLPLEVLDATEQARLQRYRPLAKKCEFAAGRIALRRWLAQALDCPPQAVPLQTDADGKPQLPARCRLHCNLSHSRGCILLALGPQALGVDVEFIDQRSDWQRLSHRYFTTDEAERIAADPDPRACFFQTWTCKEAVVKALGTGLGLGLQRFAVDPDLPTPTLAWHDPSTPPPPGWDTWRVQILPAPEGFRAACCSREAAPADEAKV